MSHIIWMSWYNWLTMVNRDRSTLDHIYVNLSCYNIYVCEYYICWNHAQILCIIILFNAKIFGQNKYSRQDYNFIIIKAIQHQSRLYAKVYTFRIIQCICYHRLEYSISERRAPEQFLNLYIFYFIFSIFSKFLFF